MVICDHQSSIPLNPLPRSAPLETPEQFHSTHYEVEMEKEQKEKKTKETERARGGRAPTAYTITRPGPVKARSSNPRLSTFTRHRLPDIDRFRPVLFCSSMQNE